MPDDKREATLEIRKKNKWNRYYYTLYYEGVGALMHVSSQGYPFKTRELADTAARAEAAKLNLKIVDETETT